MGSNPTGAHGIPPPNIINFAHTNARMSLIHTGWPTLDDTTHRRTFGTIRRALHQDMYRDQATWLDQGSVTIRAGGWWYTLNPQRLRRVTGPYILYPVPTAWMTIAQGSRTGTPPCGHPCPHALFRPLPPQPPSLPGRYLNAVAGDKPV